jgi:hypothetical protein
MLREVRCKASSVQPVAGDHLLIACYNDNVVCEIDWDGNVVDSQEYKGPMHVQRLLDGTMLVSAYQAHEGLQVDADGKVLRRLPGDIRSGRQLWNGDLVFLRDDDGALVRLDDGGRVVAQQLLVSGEADRKQGARASTFDLDCLGGGLIATGVGVMERSAEGATSRLPLEVKDAHCAARVGDGRVLVGGEGGITMRDAAMKVQWEFACRNVCHIVPRLQPRETPRSTPAKR